jgi:hypothetical protein
MFNLLLKNETTKHASPKSSVREATFAHWKIPLEPARFTKSIADFVERIDYFASGLAPSTNPVRLVTIGFPCLTGYANEIY